VSSARMRPLMPRERSYSSSASSGPAVIMDLRSPPPKKLFLADVRTTPVMDSFSASMRPTVESKSSMKREFIVLAPWSGSSMVRVTIPSPSLSHRNMLSLTGFLLLYGCGVGGPGSDALDDGGDTHAAAHTERDEGALAAGALELVEHGAGDHRAGGAEGVAHGDRPAVDGERLVGDAHGLLESQPRVRRARLPPVRSGWSSTVPVIIAPVAPRGWPMAIAPPLTLSFSSGMSMSFWNRSTTEAKASLISQRSMSSAVSPAVSRAFLA